MDGRKSSSRFIRRSNAQPGLQVDNFTPSIIEKKTKVHQESKMHFEAVDIEASKSLTSDQLKLTHSLQHSALSSLFRTALSAVRDTRSLLSYEQDLLDRALEGVPVGDRGHSRKTCRVMILFTHEEAKSNLRDFLTTVSPLTGRRPRVGVALDKINDVSGKPFQAACMRVNYFGSPVVLFVSLEATYNHELSYTPGTEGSGFSLYNKLFDALGVFGISPFERVPDSKSNKGGNGRFLKGATVEARFHGKSQWFSGVVEIVRRNGTYRIRYIDGDIEESVPESKVRQLMKYELKPPIDDTRQVTSYNTDGEAAYTGQHRGLRHYIQTEDGLDDKKAVILRDPPHCTQTIIKRGLSQPIIEKVRKLIRAIYVYETRSWTRYHFLEEIAEDLGISDLAKLHTYFKVMKPSRHYI